MQNQDALGVSYEASTSGIANVWMQQPADTPGSVSQPGLVLGSMGYLSAIFTYITNIPPKLSPANILYTSLGALGVLNSWRNSTRFLYCMLKPGSIGLCCFNKIHYQGLLLFEPCWALKIWWLVNQNHINVCICFQVKHQSLEWFTNRGISLHRLWNKL